MPTVKKEVRYVTVAYELCCGFRVAGRRAKALCAKLKNDDGLQSADDDTRGWDGDRLAVVRVWYRSLEDANRLDAIVRRCLANTSGQTTPRT